MKSLTNDSSVSTCVDLKDYSPELLQDESTTKNLVSGAPQKLDSVVEQHKPMWKKTGSSKWKGEHSSGDLQANRAGKWKS